MLLPDEPTRIGPHLLGRYYVPDVRDWTSYQLHLTVEHLAQEQLASTAEIGATPWDQVLARLEAIIAWIRHHLDPPMPVPPPAPPPTPVDSPAWGDPVVLDQGNYGTCVGNGWAGWGDSLPVADAYTEKDARAIYYEATVIDGSPDDPDAPGGGQRGSQVRSGAVAMKNRNRLAAFAFAANLAEVNEWLDNHGPVVFGTDWTSDMFRPNGEGYIRPTGSVEGGHCYLCIQRLDVEKAYRFRNSWGTGWGLGGDFLMTEADVQTLMNQQGEACLALELPL